MTITEQRRRITALRTGAATEDHRAAARHRLAAELHGQARHDAAFALERRAERQERAAGRLRERAAELQAGLDLRLGIAEAAA
jgi:hypothetical protein